MLSKHFPVLLTFLAKLIFMNSRAFIHDTTPALHKRLNSFICRDVKAKASEQNTSGNKRSRIFLGVNIVEQLHAQQYITVVLYLSIAGSVTYVFTKHCRINRTVTALPSTILATDYYQELCLNFASHQNLFKNVNCFY